MSTEHLSRVLAAHAAYQDLAERAARSDSAVSSDMLAAAAHSVVKAEAEARSASARETWTAWRPPAAEHVVGRWSQRVFDEYGMPEPQRVEMQCEQCGVTWQTICSSGLVRAHVQRFALVHLHRAVLHHVPHQPSEDREDH